MSNKILIDSERFTATMATLAQGVINIDSGLQNIERGSRVHRAMSLLCAMSVNGKLSALPCLVDTSNGEVSEGPYYAETGKGIIAGWSVCRAGTREDEGFVCSIIAQGASEAEARTMVTALNAAYSVKP